MALYAKCSIREIVGCCKTSLGTRPSCMAGAIYVCCECNNSQWVL